jgi:hypothetical protein
MRRFLNTALRDPIFHLVVIGGLLFVADGIFNGAPDKANVIEIDEAKIAWLRSVSEKEMGRPPTDETLGHLIDSYVREEMLYREALALDMQSDDVIVRRRLAQKMRFLVESIAHGKAPGDDKLRSFYDQRRELFREPERFSFSHHYFSTDGRDSAQKDAREALARLQTPETALADQPGASSFGDPFMLAYHFSGEALAQVSRHFGDDFATALADLPVGGWSGPVRSAYGWHLVKLARKSESVVLPYEAVAERVLTQWQEEQRLKANERAFARLHEKYQVVISPAAGF